MIAQPVGRGWSALVEVWPPGSPETAEARVVPFSATLSSEKLAQAADGRFEKGYMTSSTAS